MTQASIDANRARFDLWAGGETLEAGPTACSMRWRPRKLEQVVAGVVTVPASADVSFTLTDMEAASAAVRALHAPLVNAVLPPNSNGLPWWRRMLGGTS